MQDKYAGDIGDFGKFILLKQLLLTCPPELRLGINWYNVTNEVSSANDGRHVAYLDCKSRNRQKFEQCDPELYHNLRGLIERGKRSIAELERMQLLAQTAKYFSQPIPPRNPIPSQRMKDRLKWFEQSQEALSSIDAIFLDPDNGIQTPSVTKAQSNSVKYAFLDEIKGYFDSTGLIIVYNHRDRTPDVVYRQKFIDAQASVGNESLMRVLRFKRFSVRDYVFFYRKEHSETVRKLFSVLTSRPFDFLFEEFVV